MNEEQVRHLRHVKSEASFRSAVGRSKGIENAAAAHPGTLRSELARSGQMTFTSGSGFATNRATSLLSGMA